MFPPFRLFLAGFLIVGFGAPQVVSAQADDGDDAEEAVFETEDGRRIIISEQDSDGDRPSVERHVLRRPNRAMFRQRGEGGFPRIERHGKIIFRDENGEERHFSMNGDGMRWLSDSDGMISDTTIDGKRVMIIRTPGGEEQIIELDGLGQNAFSFRMPDFEHNFDFEAPEGHEMRLRMFGDGGSNEFAFGPNFMHLNGMMGASPETRREMMGLERRSVEIASRLRGNPDSALERELDDVLEQLFELRGRSRAERAAHMEQQAEELRQEARELRESLDDRNRDRQNLIEERKRELLGVQGSGW